MSATDILAAAAGHIAERATHRDQPEGERSMARTVARSTRSQGTLSASGMGGSSW